MSKPKILCWDLEFYAHKDWSGRKFAANDGVVLCGAWKAVGGATGHYSCRRSKVWRKDHLDDREVVRRISQQLRDCDMWVTWNGKGCDVPFLNTRLLIHGLPTIDPAHPHVDLYLTAKYQLSMSSNGQAAASLAFGAEPKMPVEWRTWLRIAMGGPGMEHAMKKLEARCLSDIRGLEGNYLRMRPLVKGHPNLNVIADGDVGCPACGGTELRREGVRITRTSRAQRYQCKECGAWSHGKAKKVADVR